MENKNLEHKLKKIMALVFEVNILKINENASTDTLQKWDSLKHINLITALEEEFSIRFNEKDIANMTNYKMIYAALKEKNKIKQSL
ncbi:MAG: acyl carrier protein [Elusimicrobia bacterium]|nr:acyl carrier protein [Elusimicrobiota bacterium]